MQRPPPSKGEDSIVSTHRVQVNGISVDDSAGFGAAYVPISGCSPNYYSWNLVEPSTISVNGQLHQSGPRCSRVSGLGLKQTTLPAILTRKVSKRRSLVEENCPITMDQAALFGHIGQENSVIKKPKLHLGAAALATSSQMNYCEAAVGAVSCQQLRMPMLQHQRAVAASQQAWIGNVYDTVSNGSQSYMNLTMKQQLDICQQQQLQHQQSVAARFDQRKLIVSQELLKKAYALLPNVASTSNDSSAMAAVFSSSSVDSQCFNVSAEQSMFRNNACGRSSGCQQQNHQVSLSHQNALDQEMINLVSESSSAETEDLADEYPASSSCLNSFRVDASQTVAQTSSNLLFRSDSAFPNLSWGEKREVWNLMCLKDSVYRRSPAWFKRHPAIEPNMRTVLLDWIVEVCATFKLHRETFHLSIDFLDRYMSAEMMPVHRNCLQLIGVTCLFIAAKLEEIYPPKLEEFCYLTDGACTRDQVTAQELIILKVLNWSLSPITVNNWVTLYLQIAQQLKRANETATHCSGSTMSLSHQQRIVDGNGNFNLFCAQFPRLHLLKVAQLVDLCLLDAESLQFQYSLLAAAAICHVFQDEQLAMTVSGYSWVQIVDCIQWMVPFFRALSEGADVLDSLRPMPEISSEDVQNIQLHNVGKDLLDRVHGLRVEMRSLAPRYSPVFASKTVDFLPTPPNSDERPNPGFVSRTMSATQLPIPSNNDTVNSMFYN